MGVIVLILPCFCQYVLYVQKETLSLLGFLCHSFLWFVSLALKVSPFFFSHQMQPDGTIFDTEIYIKGYNIVRCDGHRKGGGVGC